MKLKIVAILIVGIFILSGFGAGAIKIFNIDKSINWGQKDNLNTYGNDSLDQYQFDYDFFAPVGPIFIAPDINYYTVQSFIPTKNVLTRVELLVGKNHTATYDFELAIRDDLLGSDILTLSLGPEKFLSGNFSWVEFDFEDILVIPGNTYYIVANTSDEPDNWYAWAAKLTDAYPNGSVWWSEDNGSTWEIDPEADLAFATYGYNNLPPGPPAITGPTSGKPGSSYSYTFETGLDPDGDEVSYYIDWGDGSTSGWTIFIPSGPPGYTESHSWSSNGNYTIRAKVKDEYGFESDWSEITVKIPRAKSINIPFNWLYNFLQTHPKIFPILRDLLN